MNFSRRYVIFCLLLLVGLAGSMLWSATRPQRTVSFHDTLPDSSSQSYIIQDAGWTRLADGLGVTGQARAIRGYEFPKHAGQKVFLTLRLSLPKGGSNRVHIRKPDPKGEDPSHDKIWDNQDVNFRDLDISGWVGDEGLFQIFVLVETGKDNTAKPLLESFAIRFEPTPAKNHVRSFIFFMALTLCAYGIFLFMLPIASAGMQALARANRLLVLASIIAAIVLLGHPEHWRNKAKRFDDYSAIGVAAHLGATGFDPSLMVFRSRIRPSLTAWILPWTQLMPHRLVSSTFTPSDRKERMFFFYDREGWSFGTRLFPELSAFFALVLLMGMLALARTVQWSGGSANESAGVFLFGALFMTLCLYNSISSAANFSTTVVAALAAWAAWRKPSAAAIIGAGLIFSFTILLKETFVVLAAGIGLYQLWSMAGRDEWKRGARQMVVFWGATAILPLVYYGFALDTGFAELPANHKLLYFHQQLHKEYEALTVWSGLKTYWQAFSIGLPLAILGMFSLILRWRTLSDADRFFVCWFAGSLLTLTMPYIFPRFLIFSIPPMAYLAVKGCEEISRIRRIFAKAQ